MAFSLVICFISAIVPIASAVGVDDDLSSGSSAVLGNFYYWGDETYIERCQTLLATAKAELESQNKVFSGNFAIGIDKNSAVVYIYDTVPTFEFKHDDSLDKDVYQSDEVISHRFTFYSSDTKIDLSSLDVLSPVEYLFSDNFVFFYTISSFVNETDPSRYPYIILTSFEIEGGTQGGKSSVDVSFSPAFSMDMNGDLYNPRLGFGGSTSDMGSHLSLTVENHLKNPVQIRMYITDKGEKFSLGDVSAGPTHTGFQNRNWNCDFIFMKEDWVFAPDISTGDTSKSRLQYKPTSWHYVDTFFNQSISWASINCVENKEYDVVVEYIELTPDDIYSDTTLVSDEKIVECYRQTFSIYKRSVAYDPDCEDFGVLGIHGYDDYLTAENSSSGYIDDDGKTQIKDTLNVNPDFKGSGSVGSGSHQLYSGSGFSLSSLQASTSSVLSFFRYVFNFLPSQVWNAFYFLIVVAVVFGFIKILKG